MKPKEEISHIKADTTIFLKTGNPQSPTCEVNIDFMYLAVHSEEDSLTRQINQHLQRIAFGSDYSTLQPEESVREASNSYLTNYRKELTSYYDAEIKNGTSDKDLPPWYSYSHEIETELKRSQDSLLNFSVTHYDYTGGAHPNTYITWTNINAHTGAILTKADVFHENQEHEIISLIQKHLIAEANHRLETDTITSIQGLRENGVLLNVDLYVPDNFLITTDGVSFLYNRYDIAPYAVGDFQLHIPYAEIKNLMKMK